MFYLCLVKNFTVSGKLIKVCNISGIARDPTHHYISNGKHHTEVGTTLFYSKMDSLFHWVSFCTEF